MYNVYAVVQSPILLQRRHFQTEIWLIFLPLVYYLFCHTAYEVNCLWLYTWDLGLTIDIKWYLWPLKQEAYPTRETKLFSNVHSLH